MAYHLLFCLIAEDTGSPANTALCPIVDQSGRPRIFQHADEAHRALTRLKRLADGLAFYISAIPKATDAPADAIPGKAVFLRV